MKSVKIGLLPTSRGFFDASLASQMRMEAIEALREKGVDFVVPDVSETAGGCVDSLDDARFCASLFRREDVDGVIVVAVNFGSERAVALALKQIRVPVLLFACQEEEVLTMRTKRRDAFCGLLSIADALRQVGIPYSVAPCPVGYPRDAGFHQAVEWFCGVCRVVRAVRSARYGQIGTRPDAFWTCRFDEAGLQRLGPTTVTLDLSEVIAGVNRLTDEEPEVLQALEDLRGYAEGSRIDAKALIKLGKLDVWLRRWAQANRLDALAVQCWTSIQQNLGICSCGTMSRLTEGGLPCACEADVLGALSMHVLQEAAGSPAALADWNNLHNEDSELVNLWHCGVFPASFAAERPRLNTHGILAASGVVAPEDAQGVVEFKVSPSPATLFRVTKEPDGPWRCVIAEGAFEENSACTSGSYGWCRVPGMQTLYRDILLQHFPHHVAVVRERVGNVLWEAFGRYLGFSVHRVGQPVPGAFDSIPPFSQS